VTRFGKTAGAAATYVVLAGLQRGVSLLILPFVTHAITPPEYGAASTLGAASAVLTAVIATPLIPLIMRAAARGEENGPALLRAAGIYCYFVVPGFTALAAPAVALLVPKALGVSGFLWAIELLAIGFGPALSVFALYVAQAREDVSRFVWLSSISVLITAATKLLLVVVLQLGVLGWVLSDLLSAVIAAILAIAFVRLPRARVHPHDIRYALNFTLPLIPHAASLWALYSLSRPAMAAVSSLEQVGLLSFGLNLAQIAGMVLAESNRAALPRYSREILPAPTRETLEPVRWQLIGAFTVPAVVGCGTAVAGQWLFPADYWPSFALTGVLLIGQAAYGLYLIPMNYLTQTAGLPKFSALASGAGAAVILVLILLLGHRYGAVGVAYATTAGYLTMAAVAMILTMIHKLDIAWRSWLPNWPEVVLAAGALTCSVAALASPVGSTLSWTFTAACLVLAPSAILLTARREYH
jgi:O-antigen/teichoic acid export membrane protein